MTGDGPDDASVAARSVLAVSAVLGVVAALGVIALAGPAMSARSGHGDGFGDIVPLLVMLLTLPMTAIGAVLLVITSLGRTFSTAVAALVVHGLAALMTFPVLTFGKTPTTLVSVSEFVAAGAALAAVVAVVSSVPLPGAGGGTAPVPSGDRDDEA